MRKLILVATLGLVTAFGLSACNKQENTQTQEVMPTKPASPTDKAGWKKYLVAIVKQNLDGMTAKRPYLYFIPAGDDDEALSQRMNQLSNVQDVVARTVLPGNLMAFGGPDSATTADFIVQAFQNAEKSAFKGVIVLFIGDKADEQRVVDALAPSGATVRFVQM